MKKIVILRCLKSNDVCTGASCLEAFYDRTGKFQEYSMDENLQLVAFFSCNGCEEVRFKNQDGLAEKLKKILDLKPSAVHIGICTKIYNKSTGEKEECNTIKEISKYIQGKGITVIRGTHA